MKVKAIRKITLDNPIPVYDATVPIYENFMLANKIIVHNSAKVARHRTFQACFSLKGKPLNVMEVSKDKVNKNTEIAGIFASIGLDLTVDDPISKIRFGKIIFLSDADVDGPLIGSTKVLTLDGKNPTIKELAKRWKKNNQPIWVLSRDKVGKLIPTQAIEPRMVKSSNEMIKITLDDGTVFKCSTNHGWMMSIKNKKDDRRIDYLGNEFIRAKDLVPGDSLNSINLEDRTPDGYANKKNSTYPSVIDDPITTEQFGRRVVPVHRIAYAKKNPKMYEMYVRHNKGSKSGDRYVIHHDDHDTRNNELENLVLLHGSEHGAVHFKEYVKEYNGSKKHLKDLKIYNNSARGKQHRVEASEHITAYNVSQKHRDIVGKMNIKPIQIRLQTLGRIARQYLGMKKLGLRLTKRNWNATPYYRVPLWDKTWNVYSLKEVRLFIKRKRLTINDGYDIGMHNSPRKCHSPVPNHKVVKVEHLVLGKPVDYYCMTTPETGNFFLVDKNGNGVGTSNSHINTLLLTLFWKYLPELFYQKRIYMVKAPEFMTHHKGKLYFGASKEIVYKLAGSTKVDIKQLKGWGACDAEDLQPMAFDKGSRKLYRILPPRDKKGKLQFELLMGRNPLARQKLLGVL